MRTVFLLLVLVVCTSVFGLTTPDRSPDAAKPDRGEVVIDPPTEEWSLLTSNAFFSKPTTLLEHRDITRLRGIVSTRTNRVKEGQPFSEKRRLDEVCKNIPKSYIGSKSPTTVRAKVVFKGLSHCHIQVRDKDGLIIEQLLFVSKHPKKDRTYTTHTITFFYPVADESKAAPLVSKFLAFVKRTDG